MKNNSKKVAEAHRYIANGKQILRDKGGKHEGFYSDSKYVRMAGHAAWNGVLLALNLLMKEKGAALGKKDRHDADNYREFLGSYNKKILKVFNSAYSELHLFCGYDGVLDATVFRRGVELAETLINWVDNQMNHTNAENSNNRMGLRAG